MLTHATLPYCIAWMEQGRLHLGIVIIPQQRYSIGEIVRRILRLTSSEFDLTGGLYYLSNFRVAAAWIL